MNPFTPCPPTPPATSVRRLAQRHTSNRWHPGRWTLAALLAMTTGCAQPQGGEATPPAEPPVTAPVPPAAAVLSAQPDTLVFSGTRDGTGAGASAEQTVTFQNSSGASVTLKGVTLSNAAAFGLVSPPTFPLTLAAGAGLSLNVRLLPGTSTGVLRATLRAVGDSAPVGEVELAGLRAAGLEGDSEPALAQIVDALGYRINVGSSALILGTGAEPIGDEVMAPLFERASAGKVTLRPVARYSPDGPSAYGTFVLNGDTARTQVLGTMTSASFQSLNPQLEAGSQTTFDPGSAPFGIYLAANGYAKQTTFSLDRLNTGPTRHAVRAYPLKDRAGKAVPNSYLLGFEPSANGDYQDAVFVLENVRPVTGAAALAVKWLPRTNAPTTLYEGQGAAVNGELYVFGGFDRNVNDKPTATRAASAYNPATDRWRKLRDIPDFVTHAGVAVDGQNIYLAGGFLGNHPGPQTNHVWKYSVATDTWAAMPPLPQARGGGGLARV
ncbi:kelch repeat-containing protein, partial [Deinococcus frigens]